MFFKPYSDRGSLRYRLRRRRFENFARLLRDVACRDRPIEILDIGGTPNYWKTFGEHLAKLNYRVTVLNLDVSDGIQEGVRCVRGNACDIPFENNAFDVVHSNSVIEHVGDWAAMCKMAAEITRLAPVYYVQVPYFWFPFEPHFRFAFFHWMPEQVRMRVVKRFALGCYPKVSSTNDAMALVQSARLLDRTQLRALFPDGHIEFERVAGVAKSLIACRSADVVLRSESMPD